jgi:hypothetical protein
MVVLPSTGASRYHNCCIDGGTSPEYFGYSPVLHILSVSVALGIQHAKRMRLLYCHLWAARLYNIFPHYLLNGTIFGKVIEHEMCVLSVPVILSGIFLILRRIHRAVVINLHRS